MGTVAAFPVNPPLQNPKKRVLLHSILFHIGQIGELFHIP